MRYIEIAKSLQGLNTLQSVMEKLKIDRAKAIYVMHRLRKLGYVRTKYMSDKRRVYHVSELNKQTGICYTDFINEGSPIKLAESHPYYVHARSIVPEEALIYAIKKGTIRYIIACLCLFRKIKDWSYLYKLAKNEHLVRQITALYEVSRLYVKKVRKMPLRFHNLAKPGKNDDYEYIVKPYSSDDFKEIEKKWKIYIPLNRADLAEYKGIRT